MNRDMVAGQARDRVEGARGGQDATDVKAGRHGLLEQVSAVEQDLVGLSAAGRDAAAQLHERMPPAGDRGRGHEASVQRTPVFVPSLLC